MLASPPRLAWLTALLTAGLGASVATATPLATSWLEAASKGVRLAGWNQPRSPVPRAPKDERPAGEHRPVPAELRPRAAEERAVAKAGWRLDEPTLRKGALAVVRVRTADEDTMGRPHHIQALVFSKGRFAGTLSPAATMPPRTDGVIDSITLEDERHLRVTYLRYGPDDGLCCPSRVSRAAFVIETRGGAPVAVPGRVETVANP